MSLFQFPFKRKTLPTLGNPVFVSDLLAANELILDGLGYLFNSTPFAIVAGCAYTAGAPGSYAPGVVWLNGQFCYVDAAFSEGLYLSPTTQDVNPQPYSPDQVPRPTYTLLKAAPGAIGSQLFTGTMDQYRMDFASLKASILAAEAVIATLKGAAFLDVGNTPNTVAAGNDSRLVGDLTFFENTFAERANVIEKGTATDYTPVNPNDPVNKQYADQFVKILAKGIFNAGDADNGSGTNKTVPIGVTLPNNTYRVLYSIESFSASGNSDIFFQTLIRNKTTNSFDVFFREPQAETSNVFINWIIVAQ